MSWTQDAGAAMHAMGANGGADDGVVTEGVAGGGAPGGGPGTGGTGTAGLPPAVLRAMVERVADGLVVTDGDGAIVFANPAAAALFGRPADALLGMPLGTPAVSGDTSEIEVVRPGGRVVTAELRAAPTEWEGRPAWLVSLRDVTERREAEAQAHALARAEAANRAKSEFLATMSHELRTPLNAILGYTDLLSMGLGGPVSDRQREKLERVRASANHLLSLVNEVLDLARVEEGQLEVRSDRLALNHVAETAALLVQPQADAAGLRMTVRCEPGHAPIARGDEGRVRQVLANLLANAIKFTDAGGRVEVVCGWVAAAPPHARLQGDGPWVFVRVSDTGAGIPPEQMEKVFQPFVQAQGGHTRRRDGSGLGLTIGRRLARLMGGDLTATSEVGEGSTFTIWLPAAEDERAPEAEAPDAADRDADRPGDGGGEADAGATAPDAARDGASDAGSARRAGDPQGTTASPEALAAVGRALLRGLATVQERFIARLRERPPTPSVGSMTDGQLGDHVPALLADLATVLQALAESGGAPSALVADGAAIQRLVAERHGIQRAPYRFSRAALESEFELLREVVLGVTRETVAASADASLAGDDLDAALALLDRHLAQAAHVSCRTLERARGNDERE